MRLRTALQLAVLAILAALGGCPSPYTPVVSGYNFDSCDSDGGDQLCGFNVVSGTVMRVPAFTAGEYALQMNPGSLISLPFSWGDCFDGTVSLLARCDAGGSLQFQESLHGTVMSQTASMPGSQWGNVQIAFPRAFVPTSQQIPFVQLRIGNPGTGNCVIDEIALGGDEAGVCP